MPLVSPVTAGSVFDRARFLLNDTAAAIYTNDNLIEPLNIAMDMLRQVLQDNDISVTAEVSAAIEITAGVTGIGGDGEPALPNDFLVPITLWERTSGSSQGYQMMQKKDFLPKYDVPTTFLVYWTYQDQKIKFLESTSDIDVKIDYRANRLFEIINESTQIDLINAKNFLSMQAAGYAAEFIGENDTRANKLYAMASHALDMVLNLDIKNKQNVVTRKRPFMASFRRNRGGR